LAQNNSDKVEKEKTKVRDCKIPDCVLYPFRMGKNPNRAGIGRRFKKGILGNVFGGV